MRERDKVQVNPLTELDNPPAPEIPLAAGARGRYLISWTYNERDHIYTVFFDDGGQEVLTGNLSNQEKRLAELQGEAKKVNTGKINREEREWGKPGKRP